MFCSHCGKSIRPDEASCPHCGAMLGEDRFEGNMYTSAQARVPLDEIEHTGLGKPSAFTRTDYMSYDNQPEEDLYSNTTYRPLLSDEEDMSREDLLPEEDGEAEYADEQTNYADGDGEPYPAEDGDAPLAEGEYAEEESEYAEAEEAFDQAEAAYEEAGAVYGEADASEDEAADLPEENAYNPTAEPKYELRELKPARISPKVQRYMREMEERKATKAGKTALRDRLGLNKKNDSLYEEEEEPAADIPGYEDSDDSAAYDEAAYENSDAALDLDTDAAYDSDQDTSYDEAAYDDTAYDEAAYEDDEDGAPASSGLNFSAVLDAVKSNKKLQIGLGVVAALIVLVFGVRYLLYVTSSLGTKIAGVTNSVYSQGITLIGNYSSDAYRDEMVKSCAVNPTYAQEEMDKDMAELSALLPSQPQENDELFVTTLTILHKAVQTVIKADAEAEYNGTAEARKAASQQEWLVIQDGVAQLKNAATVAQLSTLATQVESAVIPTPTPSPSPTPTPAPPSQYTTLQESSGKSEAAKKLQARLIELGYLDDTADGYYGAKTTEAVKAFQTAIGMKADGVATAAVQEALYASDAPVASAPDEAADDTDADNADA